MISIHAPRGGSDMKPLRSQFSSRDFNPRSPWGERLKQTEDKSGYYNFNPRSPWGERPGTEGEVQEEEEFQSTLPVGGATAGKQVSIWQTQISIHAPRGGSDSKTFSRLICLRTFQSTLPVGGATTEQHYNLQMVKISIHAPRGGSDHATEQDIH